MKKLHELTEEQAKHICKLINEPFNGLMTNNDGKWDILGVEVQINTTSTLNHNENEDGWISIKKDGTIKLQKNNGDWNGQREITINTVSIIDYLRSEGYNFSTNDESIKITLNTLNNILKDKEIVSLKNPSWGGMRDIDYDIQSIKHVIKILSK